MNSTNYDKIIAELITFMRKLDHEQQLYDRMAKQTTIHLFNLIQDLIKHIDKYAELDLTGWIK